MGNTQSQNHNPEVEQIDPFKELKEKIREVDDWSVLSTDQKNISTLTTSAKYGDEPEHEPIKNQYIWRSCHFCRGSLTLCFTLRENYMDTEIAHCKKCNFLLRHQTHHYLDEERSLKLKQILESKITEMTQVMEYCNSNETSSTSHFLYARWVTEIDTKSYTRPNSKSTAGDSCDVCGTKKDFFRKEGPYYDFNEHYFCSNCNLETVERLLNVNAQIKENASFAKLMEIKNNKIPELTQYSSDQSCRDYFTSSARYEEDFLIPEIVQEKGQCKVCKGVVLLIKQESPEVAYMTETSYTYSYCVECKLHFLDTYEHEYN